MKEKYKKYIGNKAFYMMVMAIAVPIMIQNGLTNFVNLLDNIMVGRLGTEEMSGVSIVNQIIFVYNLCIFGEQQVWESLPPNISDKKMMKGYAVHSDIRFGWR